MDFESINLIWIIRLLFPLVVFWLYWRDNTKPKLTTPREFVYDRDFLLSLKGGFNNDYDARSKVPKALLVDSFSNIASRKSGKSQTTGNNRREVESRIATTTTTKMKKTSNSEGDDDGRSAHRDQYLESMEENAASMGGQSSLPEQQQHPQPQDGENKRENMEKKEHGNLPAARNGAERVRNSHIERLVNYLSFHPPPKRIFLPETPPPPPPPMPEDQDPTDVQRRSAKLNEEAISILKGSLVFKKIAVAHQLFDQLTSEKLPVKEETFNLIVQLAVAAQDIKAASNYLMKMESAGLCPSVKLLGTVMQLYSQSKNNKNQTQQVPQQQQQPHGAPTSWREAPCDNPGAFPPDFPQLSPDAAEFYPRQVSNANAAAFEALVANTGCAYDRKTMNTGNTMWCAPPIMSPDAAEFIPGDMGVGVIPNGRDAYLRKRIS